MIWINDTVFHLETKNTSYCFRVMKSGHLEHLHYGARISIERGLDAIIEKHNFTPGCSVMYAKLFPNQAMEDISLELSTVGKGDTREPMIDLIHADGSRTCDFVYESASIMHGKAELLGLPSSYDETGECMSLILMLKDKNSETKAELIYSVFEDCDIITRSMRIHNQESGDIRILRALSMQLDIDEDEFYLTDFHGTWAREMQMNQRKLLPGICMNDSKSGFSSNHCNPFFMLCRSETGETQGECYGGNLIYSGNHYEAFEVSPYHKTRVLSGINPSGFEYILSKGESFETPEAVLTFSDKGYEGISRNMHSFIREHIVRGKWKKKERPVLVNSWESFYFKFNETKLCRLAAEAKKLGAELFVLDDGWFGKRNDDTSSLGDWTPDKEKLPRGLKGLAGKIKSLGLDFGIWVEPEMISENSQCYRKHPDWALRQQDREHSLGRNQMLLDLTKREVQEYIIESMRSVFTQGDITYVKWDMNRNISDVKTELGIDNHYTAGSYTHRYILGLYRILDTLTSDFPDILFEGCASGGNRFDLGMLCYMPQIWASDNTDAISRTQIQNGYSYGYPMSVIGAHVSGCPNHQTLRNTNLETRFNVAAFGLLGYECNLGELTREEKEKVKGQIAFYKKFRYSLQFGEFTRLRFTDNEVQWMVYEKETGQGIVLHLHREVIPNQPHTKLRLRNLDLDQLYHFSNLQSTFHIKEFGDLINMISPVHIRRNSVLHTLADHFKKMGYEIEEYTCSGTLLCNSGVRLKEGFCGIGYNEDTRHMPDFGSRLYSIEACSSFQIQEL